MDTQTAFQTLVKKIHAPIFFTKLAQEYKIVPNSAEEEHALLELAGLIQNAKAQDTVKQASAGHSPLIDAVDELKEYIGGSIPGVSTQTSYNRMLKSAAANLIQDDPELATAALTWAQFQAGRTQ